MRNKEEQEVRVVKTSVNPIFDALGDDRQCKFLNESSVTSAERGVLASSALRKRPEGRASIGERSDGGKRLRSAEEQECSIFNFQCSFGVADTKV